MEPLVWNWVRGFRVDGGFVRPACRRGMKQVRFGKVVPRDLRFLADPSPTTRGSHRGPGQQDFYG